MPDLKSADNIYLILAFVVPGLVIVYVRARFITGRIPPSSEAILSYITLSFAYYALAFPAVEGVVAIKDDGFWKVVAWFSLIFIGPALLGIGLGKITHSDLFRRAVEKCGFHLVHPVPSAWDSRFVYLGPNWVLVTLKDGSRVAGWIAAQSFASSDPAERDLFVEKVYEIGDENVWIEQVNKSILIAGGEIRTVEFWIDKEMK